MTTITEPVKLPRDKIDTTAMALFGAMFLGLALVGGSSLWPSVSSAFQQITQSGGADTAVIEAEQRKQADALRRLERGIIKVALEQDTMTKQVDHYDTSVSYRFGQIEAEISGLDANALAAEQRKQADAIRKLERGLIKVGIEQDSTNKQLDHADSGSVYRFGQVEAGIATLESKLKADTAAGALSDAIGQLGVAAAHTRTDIYGLRSSLDEHVQAYRKEIAAIATRLDAVEQASQSHRIDALVERLDRLEQLVSRDMTSSIRPPARKKALVKRKHRAAQAVRTEAQPAYPPQMGYPQYHMQAAGGIGGMQ
jgi:hypothetical protein